MTTRRELLMGSAALAAATALPTQATARGTAATSVAPYVVVGFSGEAATTLMLGQLQEGTFVPHLQIGYRDSVEASSPELKAEFLAFLAREGYRWPTRSPLVVFGEAYFGAELHWATKPGWHDFELPGHGRVALADMPDRAA